MDGDEQPDPLTGHVVVGRLTLPRLVHEALERLAEAQGVTVLQLVRRGVTEWLRQRGDL